ncbi:uncharacterized protein LOC110839223 [Zootermopsis nevadensis]|uniref:uncharacterized protein LOC110839223 n=1 Tax=Zootermopsis nevadensis TaxID=136037 RepID=UPI000B8E4DE7|nr:uncharacterized protein LOC110839223 [Zootermopsis nevadensis]
MRSLECVNQDPRCLFQNLAICSIFYCFCSDHNLDDELSSRMLKYIKGSMRNWKVQDDRQQLLKILRHVFQCTKCWDCHSTDLGKILDCTVKNYKTAYEHGLFELLSDLAVTPNQTHLYRCAGFQEWVESLPELLCAPTIPATAVGVLAKFACQNNPLFYKSLCQKLPDILNNLCSVIVTGAGNECEGRKNISNILYWVKDWSRDAVTSLSNLLRSENCDNKLASHITDLLASRYVDL